MVEVVVDDLSLNKMRGGFLYLHFEGEKLVENDLSSLMAGIFMSALLLNELLGEYSREELIGKLKTI